MPTAAELNLKPEDVVFLANLEMRDLPSGRFYGKADMTHGTKAKVIKIVPNWGTLLEKLSPPDHIQAGTVDNLSDIDIGAQFSVGDTYSAFFIKPEEYIP